MAQGRTLAETLEIARDVAKRMRMSHIYQPLMLMELLGRRSPAPAQDIARRIRKPMVGRVLTGNGIPATAMATTH